MAFPNSQVSVVSEVRDSYYVYVATVPRYVPTRR